VEGRRTGPLKIKVLGSSGSEVPGHNLPAFLIDGEILLDAGTIGLSLTNDQQWKIKHILISHSHLDHIKGIPFLLDNIVIKKKRHSITLMSGKDVLGDLKKNVLNDRIWPDFSKIPNKNNPVLRFSTISPSRSKTIDGLKVYCERVNHSVPAYGYIIVGKNGRAVAYTGDTGPTERLWKKMAKINVTCLIIEVSFPNRMSRLAETSGHLTAKLLKKEISKMETVPSHIYITHAKPQFIKDIRKEIKALNMHNIEILQDNIIITV
jgi:ribonuclease BN (tRNA processing enzyme)